MRINLILEILDVPRQLISVLSPIGELGANLVTVIEMDVGKRDYAYKKVMEIAKEKNFLVIDEV